MTQFTFAFASVLLLLLGRNVEAINERPVVALFSQPSTSTAGNCGGNCLYIASSYVKFIESAGARLILLF